jgi:predicted  nucleic acid-binding Zn-ribbon protein
VYVVSAEDRVMAPQQSSDGGVATLSDDDLLDALNSARAARARAEQLYTERDEAVAKLQAEVRDLSRLRDNFHSLYREERELRSEAERTAEERIGERDALQQEVILLHSDVDRLDRMVQRFQAQRAEQPAVETSAPTMAPTSPAADTRVQELERDAGMLRAHAAELETAVTERTAQLSAANQRVTDLEREVAMARTQLAGSEAGERDSAVAGANRRIAELESELATLRASHQALQSGRSEHAADLAAGARRIHDLDGELASLRLQHADLQAAYDRVVAARDALKQTIAGEQAQREEAQHLSESAQQRVQEAVMREQEAVRAANHHQTAAERADHELQAAKATIGVLEQRVHDAEAARAAAEQRAAAVGEELSFVRTDVLTGHAAAPAKRTLLRRRPADHSRHATATHVETVGTAVGADATVEVSGSPEDVEAALHRRLFGGE